MTPKGERGGNKELTLTIFKTTSARDSNGTTAKLARGNKLPSALLNWSGLRKEWRVLKESARPLAHSHPFNKPLQGGRKMWQEFPGYVETLYSGK